MLGEVRAALADRCGLRMDEVSDEILERAVRRAADDAGVSSLPEFVGAIGRDVDPRGAMLQHLVRKVTVGETFFLRHEEDIDWIRTTVLPELIERRTRDGSRTLRMWSAGCATGEEPYTLALLAREALPDPDAWTIEVHATDINDLSLAAARVAEYGQWSFRGVDEATRTRWFDRLGTRWRPIEEVRHCVDFDYLNLRDPIYPSILTRTTSIDLLLCRNVFLYFHEDTVSTVLQRFAECIHPDGWILTGPSDLFHLTSLPAPLASEPGAPHRHRRADKIAAAVAPRPRMAPHLGGRLARVAPMAAAPRMAPPADVEVPSHAPLATAAALQRAPETEPILSDAAPLLALLHSGRFADALSGARLAVERNPLSLEATRCLALATTASGKLDDLEPWKRLVYLAPTAPDAHLGLGMAYKRARKWSDARRHFQAVVRLLEGIPDSDCLPGPDALPVGWVRAACRSMTSEAES